MKNALMLALCGALALSAAEETIRPLHYLSTDKPYYRPGETVYIRDVVLDGLSNCPLKESGLYRYDLVIEGPKGDEVARRPAQLRSSSAGLSWSVPKDAAGGVYTVKAKCDDGGAPAERKFEVCPARPAPPSSRWSAPRAASPRARWSPPWPWWTERSSTRASRCR